jgi:hypothetical protein
VFSGVCAVVCAVEGSCELIARQYVSWRDEATGTHPVYLRWVDRRAAAAQLVGFKRKRWISVLLGGTGDPS